MDKDLEKQIQTEANGGQSWTIRRPTLNKRWTNWGSMSDTPHRALSTESSDVPWNKNRLMAIALLFGLEEQDTSRWPGVLVFCQHLETCFEELLTDRFAIIWRLLGRDPPSSSRDVWDWCFAVLRAFETLHAHDSDPSIEKACQELIQGSNIEPHTIRIEERNKIVQAIFAVLCWSSATLKPILDVERMPTSPHPETRGYGAATFSLVAENSLRQHICRDLRRPVSKMFYSFRDALNTDEQWRQHHLGPADGDGPATASFYTEDVLYESNLNYFSLHTTGRVRLKWVNTLACHLTFERSTHTLCLFRYPSFCAASTIRNDQGAVLRNITSKLLPSHCHDGSMQDPYALHREILLSYRLLFGQSSRSRGLVLQSLKSDRRATQHDGSTVRESIDKLLLVVCTTPLFSSWGQKNIAALPGNLFPVSARDLDDQLQERDTYSARDDFPVFGKRLLTLQHHNLRQQPSKMRDLWRDRRNPLQWYTFWAVFLVGGISIVLSLLQLAVSAAQLYIAVRAPNGS